MDNKNDFEAYIADLKAPWKTMHADLETAMSIINAYNEIPDDAPALVTISESHNEDEAVLTFPDWQTEVESTFIEQYGAKDGRHIFKKTIMRLFQLAKGTPEQLH